MFHFEEIEEQIKAFATSFSRKTNREARPYARPSKDTLETIIRYEFRKAREEQNDTNTPSFTQSHTDFKKHSSLKRLEELRPIFLSQMQVNKIHYGTYLVCRTVQSGFYYVDSLHLLIQDELEEIENVKILNYTTNQVDPDELFPPGDMFIIKEPFIKSMDLDPKQFYIRVDSPSDIIIITENILKSNLMSFLKSYRDELFEEMNREGNTFFVAKKYYDAVTSYSKALSIRENDPKVLTNLAAAYLNLEKYDLAFSSAQKALEIQESEKAHYRLAKSAYSMRQFQTAIDHFEKCSKINPNNQQAKEELEKSRKRLKESKTGKYDMKNLIEQVKNGVKRIDVADFVHSSIQIAEIQGKDKGVKATKPIKRGTLLVCSKAFSIAYLDESKSCPVFNVNAYMKRVSSQEQSQNLKNLMHKMLNDPKNAEEVYKLYAGKDIDRNNKLPEAIIDVHRVEAIQINNSFTSQEVIDIGSVGISLPKKDNTGLWIFPSYFNHSCMTNTKRMFLADLMLIYASHDIEQDEEITISYFGMENYNKRKEICEAYGFTCKCKLCQLDKKDEQLFNRETIVEKSKAEILTGDLSKRLKIVERIRNTYKKRKDCQFALMLPLSALAKSYTDVLNFQEAIKTFTELFEIFKDYDMDSSLFVLLSIARIYAMIGQTKKAQEATRRAYDYFVGGKEMFIYKCEHVFKFDILKKFLEKL